MSAAALRCLGGEPQAQLWPTTRSEIDEARAHGIEDVERVFTTEDLAPGHVIVAATGVSNSISCAACATWPTARGRTRS